MKNSKLIVGAVMVALVLGVCAQVQAGLYLQYLFNTDNGDTDIPQSATLGPLINQDAAGRPDTDFRNNNIGPAVLATHIPAPGGQALHFDGSSPFYFNLYTEQGNQLFPASMYNNMSVAYWVRFPADPTGYLSLVGDGND